MEEESYYSVRRAHHAGSWYEESQAQLEATLQKNLDQADVPSLQVDEKLRALIGPHAGYSYSGPTAAYAYKYLSQALQNQTEVDTILVLHPSHHVYLEGCALTGALRLETPIGDLVVAKDLRQELFKTKEFSVMEQSVDESEHSGELHYPYIAKSLVDANALNRVEVLPIMIGSISTATERHYGTVLKEVIARPNVITIISSDFCHWGSRFRYQPISDRSIPIYDYISELDHDGMKTIEMQEPGAFAKYIRETKNTVCGRHPIAVWLNAIASNKEGGIEVLEIKFVRYAQSSQAISTRDSSVSYASAIATTKPELPN
jgi:AmmeMemoRadiSam system protein B